MIQLHPGGVSAPMPPGVSEIPESGEERQETAAVRPVMTGEGPQSSLKGLLSRNLGCYVAATFLVGSRQIATWEGILDSVGNDCVVLYQPQSDSYLACDLYALKFVEFRPGTPGAGLWEEDRSRR